MAETTIASKVRNSYLTAPVADSPMNTQINLCGLQHTMTSNEKGNKIHAANGQQINNPFNIVNSVATKNFAHKTEDQIAGRTGQNGRTYINNSSLATTTIKLKLRVISNRLILYSLTRQKQLMTVILHRWTRCYDYQTQTKSTQMIFYNWITENEPPQKHFCFNKNNYQKEIFNLPGRTVALFNDNSKANPSGLAQLTQCLPTSIPENQCKSYIAKNVLNNKQAIKLPPLSLPQFNGNPLRYHE